MQPEQKVVGKGSKKSRSKSPRKKLLVAVVLVLIVLLVIATIFFKSGTLSSSHCKGRSSSEIYDKAASALKTVNENELSDVITEIKADKNYQNDPNCLMPVAIYEIRQENAMEAEKYYKKLESISGDNYAVAYKEVGIENFIDVKTRFDEMKKVIELKDGFSADVTLY